MKQINVGLLGHGVVGSGVTDIIDGIEGVHVKTFLVKDKAESDDPRCTTDVNEILNDPEIDVVAECMGGIEPACSYVLQAIENGKHAVTSNKKMLASCAEKLFTLAKEKHVRVGFEATCGGGIPWMDNVARIRRIDAIRSFQGIFNGTTNYILSRMTKEHTSFEAMLQEAQNLGYAERDPKDDIDGYDVRYKVMLSALACFDALVDEEDIIMHGIRTINEEDIASAAAMDRVCKLVGSATRQTDSISAMVMPVFLEKDDPLSAVALNYNMLTCVSDTLGTASFYGQGAGSLPTAHAVVQDILDIVYGNPEVERDMKACHIDNQRYTSRYYIRTKKPVVFSSIADRTLSGNSFLTKPVSLVEVEQFIRTAEDESLFVAEVKDND